MRERDKTIDTVVGKAIFVLCSAVWATCTGTIIRHMLRAYLLSKHGVLAQD